MKRQMFQLQILAPMTVAMLLATGCETIESGLETMVAKPIEYLAKSATSQPAQQQSQGNLSYAFSGVTGMKPKNESEAAMQRGLASLFKNLDEQLAEEGQTPTSTPSPSGNAPSPASPQAQPQPARASGGGQGAVASQTQRQGNQAFAQLARLPAGSGSSIIGLWKGTGGREQYLLLLDDRSGYQVGVTRVDDKFIVILNLNLSWQYDAINSTLSYRQTGASVLGKTEKPAPNPSGKQFQSQISWAGSARDSFTVGGIRYDRLSASQWSGIHTELNNSVASLRRWGPVELNGLPSGSPRNVGSGGSNQ